jgi:hypothetical protein
MKKSFFLIPYTLVLLFVTACSNPASSNPADSSKEPTNNEDGNTEEPTTPEPLIDFTYSKDNNIVTITGYTGKGGAITIPDTIENCPVSVIGRKAFQENSTITTVTLPASVTTIEEDAFYDSRITSINLTENLTSIGNSAFNRCSSLTSIRIPASLSSTDALGSGVFYQCTKLSSITIAEGIKTIPKHTFNKCEAVSTLVIPSTVASIAFCGLYQCTKLTTLTVKATTPPTLLDSYSIKNCTALSSIRVPEESVSAYKNAKYWKDFASIISGY